MPQRKVVVNAFTSEVKVSLGKDAERYAESVRLDVDADDRSVADGRRDRGARQRHQITGAADRHREPHQRVTQRDPEERQHARTGKNRTPSVFY